MGEALKKSDTQETILSLGTDDALSAALTRALEAGEPAKSVLDYISKDDWESMDEREDNILVFDPE